MHGNDGDVEQRRLEIRQSDGEGGLDGISKRGKLETGKKKKIISSIILGTFPCCPLRGQI